jgi:hypothetical protein
MADARHAAAHRSMLLPTDIVADTRESQKSDDEIRRILRREEPDFYALFSGPLLEELEKQKIWHWRLDRTRKVATNVFVVDTEKGRYLRFPVDSVDEDLALLNAIIDAFLVRLLRAS